MGALAFEFATAGQILFGRGLVERLGKLTAAQGSRALVIGGRDPKRWENVVQLLEAAHVQSESCAVAGEPTVERVAELVEQGRRFKAEVIIGIGGGSAIDSAKAVAGLFNNPGQVSDYLEVVGAGKPLTQPGLPWFALPTTAGTGAEVTKNAVLDVPSHRQKVSLRSPLLFARTALVDPALTDDLPQPITLATGMDALTQLIEAFTTWRAQPLTDGFCELGISLSARSLRLACNETTPAVRDDLALASLLSGMALANAGLGIVHGFAGPIGGAFGAPHGSICAALLPAAEAINLQALQEREPANPALDRYRRVAQILTGDAGAKPYDGVEWLAQLSHDLRVPRLSDLGIGQADFADIISKTKTASSTKANPIQLTEAELEEILVRAG
jgi:alcohol dehydrogenase class IV